MAKSHSGLFSIPEDLSSSCKLTDKEIQNVKDFLDSDINDFLTKADEEDIERKMTLLGLFITHIEYDLELASENELIAGCDEDNTKSAEMQAETIKSLAAYVEKAKQVFEDLESNELRRSF